MLSSGVFMRFVQFEINIQQMFTEQNNTFLNNGLYKHCSRIVFLLQNICTISCATWLKLANMVTNNAIAVVFFPLESCQTTKTNWMYKYKNNFIQDISVFKLNEVNIGVRRGGVGGVPRLCCLVVVEQLFSPPVTLFLPCQRKGRAIDRHLPYLKLGLCCRCKMACVCSDRSKVILIGLYNKQVSGRLISASYMLN